MSLITQRVRTPRPWLMLGLGVVGQASSTVFVSTPAFLIPLLHTERGVSLAEAGLLASAPTIGMVFTLIAWGALSDRIGERRVIAAGLALTALAALAAMFASGTIGVGALMLLGGMAAASPNAASGRVVVGWFPRERRGLAMGIRQMCQPLGVAVAALTIPPLAAAGGIALALLVPAVLTGISAILCAIWIVDPPRQQQQQQRADAATDPPSAAPAPIANPYRANALLWRIHAVSMLLVIPQFTVSIFGLIWLTTVGYSTAAAGLVIAVSQFLGALGRIGVGVLSDRIGSRLRPLRWVSLAAVGVMALMAAAGWLEPSWAPVALILAAIVTVADNGLGYTAVAEISGPHWSGRALGTQNTGQFISASIVGPVIGGLIAAIGYPLAFAIVALVPLVATPLIPADPDHPTDSGSLTAPGLARP
ncbi:MFS transporter [Compostimonas suwonensis]|uniref:MFS transporter n=1 Tax=Compostimonas suwonensis TaxID=1048394 RepID=A0A2M9BYQ6_9MICO|nr:MFS transporter [Compostimonas suwonensis]PJJ63221.1 MFS transporter [Compostimonas suwonensis]